MDALISVSDRWNEDYKGNVSLTNFWTQDKIKVAERIFSDIRSSLYPQDLEKVVQSIPADYLRDPQWNVAVIRVMLVRHSVPESFFDRIPAVCWNSKEQARLMGSISLTFRRFSEAVRRDQDVLETFCSKVYPLDSHTKWKSPRHILDHVPSDALTCPAVLSLAAASLRGGSYFEDFTIIPKPLLKKPELYEQIITETPGDGRPVVLRKIKDVFLEQVGYVFPEKKLEVPFKQDPYSAREAAMGAWEVPGPT